MGLYQSIKSINSSSDNTNSGAHHHQRSWKANGRAIRGIGGNSKRIKSLDLASGEERKRAEQVLCKGVGGIKGVNCDRAAGRKGAISPSIYPRGKSVIQSVVRKGGSGSEM